jgi:hypothetical protein
MKNHTAKPTNRRIRQRVTSTSQLYASFALICLVVIGIAGTGYHLLAPHGFVAGFVLQLWEKGVLYTIFSLLCIFILIGLLKFWFFDGTITKKGDWIAYLWAAVGLFYCIKLFTIGTL